MKCGVGSGPVVCSGPSPDGTCIDNSIIFNAVDPIDSITSTKCSINYSLISPQASPVSGTNNKLGVSPLFVDTSAGNFHLEMGSPAIDAADPATVDVIDFDGNIRPQGNGNDIGAFERVP